MKSHSLIDVNDNILRRCFGISATFLARLGRWGKWDPCHGKVDASTIIIATLLVYLAVSRLQHCKAPLAAVSLVGRIHVN
jgi:hypothetical protein